MFNQCLSTPLLNSSQSAKIDRLAKERYSISPEILMESAGALSAQKIIQYFSEYIKTCPVMVLCGPGHNGGDGLVLARHLHSLGIVVWVFAVDEISSALIKMQKERLVSQKISIYSLSDFNKIKEKAKETSIIVDALFGVGLKRNVEAYYGDLVKWINEYSKESGLDRGFVVSLDVPSGLGVDTGQVMGVCVRADLTLTYGLGKLGFYLQDGPGVVGQVIVLRIGFPRALLESSENTYFLVTKKWVSSVLPRRMPKDHKASQGHLLVLAGSPGFWGAGELCSTAAYRMGAGYVTWALPKQMLGKYSLQDKDMSSPLIESLKGSDMRFAREARKAELALSDSIKEEDLHNLQSRDMRVGNRGEVTPSGGELTLSDSIKEEDLHNLQGSDNDLNNKVVASPMRNLVQKLRHAFCARGAQSRTRFEQDSSLEKHSHNLQDSDNDVKAVAAKSLPLGGHDLQGSDMDAAESRRSICGDTPPDVLRQQIEDEDLFVGKTAVAIGPGLAVDESTKNLLMRLMKTSLPVVADASALVVCAQEKIFPLPSNWVITPHSGELGRFFGVKGYEVDRDRCAYALRASQKLSCAVLLKGFHSVLAYQDRCWVIPTGNAALAKAGSGDVLTGLIGALMVRGCSAAVSAAIGAFVHGLLADEWLKQGKDMDTLMASDLKNSLSFVLQSLRMSS